MEEIENEGPVLSVQKAKIKDHFLLVDYTVVENETKTKIEAEFMRFVHEDLEAALQALRVHLCLVTEQVKLEQVWTELDEQKKNQC